MKSGYVGWTALAAYIVVWDRYAPETLSSAFRRSHRPAAILVWSVTTAHLFGVLPRRYDPFYLLALER